MAFNIAITSKYDPFTYEDYIKPLENYWKEYAAHEEALSNTDVAASTLEYIINAEPENSPLRTSYANFRKKLEEASNALVNGFDATDRALLRELKSTFAKDIDPIPTQYKKLQSLIEEQRKGQLQNPSLRYNKDATKLSVGDLINDPNWSYISYNGEEITKDVVQMLSPLSQVLTGISSGRRVPGFTTILENYGLTIKDVESYLQNPETSNPKFKNLIDKAIQTALNNSGVYNWNDPQATAEAYNFAAQGVYAAIGSIRAQHSRNPIGSRVNKGNQPPEISGLGRAIYETTRSNYMNSDQNAAAKEKQEYAKSITYNPNTGTYRSTAETQAINKFNEELAKANLTQDQLPEYKEYRKKLQEVVGEAPIDNEDFIGWIVYSAKNRKHKKEIEKQYPQFADIDNGNALLQADKQVQEETRKRAAFLGQYIDPDNMQNGLKGLDGSDLIDYMNKMIDYEVNNSAEVTSNYIPLLTPEDKKQTMKRFADDYEQLVASGHNGGSDGTVESIKNSKVKGLYKVNINDGTASFMKPGKDNTKEVIEQLKDGKGELVQNSKFGSLIQLNGSYYMLRGSSQTAVMDLNTSASSLARNISTQDIRDYNESVGHYAVTKDNITTLTDLEQINLYTQLYKSNKLMQSDEDPRLQYAYIGVLKDNSGTGKLQNELYKVIFLKDTGRIVNLTSVESELYGNSLSKQNWSNIANEDAFGIMYRQQNKNTSTVRTKGANQAGEHVGY